MRTEAKLGLAVGVILLAVGVAYLLFLPKKKVVQAPPPDTSSEPTAVDNGAAVTPVNPAPTTMESLAPTTAATTAPVAGWPTSAPTATVAITPGPGANSADSAASGSATGHDPWSTALNQGQVNGQTTVTPTPAPGAVASSDTLTAGSPRKHTVKSGETFSTIAQAEYGDAKYYQRIIRANPKVNPNRLHVGQVIVLPELNNSAGSTASPVASGSSSTPGADLSATTAPSGSSLAAVDDATSTYKVQSGDTLYQISIKLYGKPDMWQKIYQLNKPAIGPDASRLKLNMVLKLPVAPTAH